MKNNIDYYAFSLLIKEKNWWFNVAEFQGILSAFWATKQSPESALSFIFFKDENIDSSAKELTKRLFKDWQKEPYSYELFLPEENIIARAEALVSWISGFFLATKKLNLKFDKENKEIIDNLAEIQNLDYDAIIDNEENRQLLNSLEEHARLALFSLLG